MTIIPQVYHATIFFGDIEVDVYSDTPPGKGGKHRNFLSGRGLAESIGVYHSTMVSKRLPKELETVLGSNFTTLQSQYKNTSGAFSQVNLWDTESATKYYFYHALENKNKVARSIVDALGSATLDRIIDDRFDRDLLKRGELQASVNSRILEIPRPWEAVYSKEFLAWVRANYYPRDFFWTYIYSFLTPQERADLERVNPVLVKTYQRKWRIHQYLNQETLDRLEPQVQIVYSLGIRSTSAQDFETRYNRHFGYHQLEMFPEF